MRFAFRLALILICLSSVLAQAADSVTLTVVTDRPDALYRLREEARFRVSAWKDGQPVTTGEFDYSLTLDGGRPIRSGKGQFGAAPSEVKGKLDAPGILRLTVSFQAEGQPVTALAAAAYSPEKIRPAAREPKGFRGFWAKKKKALAAIPVDAKLIESPQHSSAEATVWKFSLANIAGSRVYGWLGVPTRPGRYPGILTVPWAGVYPTPVDWASGWAKKGYVAVGISAHDYDVDLPEERYEALDAGPLKGWPHIGRESRETSYFLRMFLSCVRAIDYIASRPEWDRKHLIVNGSSQGGGLSLVAAGLDARVTAIAANVPALCDHLGFTQGRPNGWPDLVPNGDSRIARASAYFDAANFARHIRCPAIVGVGLIDTACPATTVYAAYNSLRGPKQIVVSPLMGHSMSQEYSDLMSRWIPAQAAK
ncbi:MAG: acetylxylan esterase [Armatimonadetes bacterium]|nr:acetylxylan esterase [Armatimonadota bacterium]